MELTKEQGEKLVKIARETISAKLENKKFVPKIEKWMNEERGVFVTLAKWPSKELRGCIGHPYPDAKLIEAVVDSAKSAAFSDTRFNKVEKEEMKHITVEISVLTIPEEIRPNAKNFKEVIKCGRDGLIVKQGWNAGLLLPQVPVEWGWDEKEFLSQTCWKAGLPLDCWLDRGTKIYRFRAQIFSENEPNGKVEER